MVNESDKIVDKILGIFKENAYKAGKCEIDTPEYTIIKACEDLLKLDYKVTELDNTDGRLCPMYPARILIPYAKAKPNDNCHDINANCPKLTQLNNYLQYAKYARCRRRFVVPVIFYQGNCICRSATISVKQETYARKAIDLACNFMFQTYYGKHIDTRNNLTNNSSNSCGSNNSYSGNNFNNSCCCNNSSCSLSGCSSSSNSSRNSNGNEEMDSLLEDYNGCPFSYDEVISKDVELLKFLNVETIVDLMVEFVKVKYFLTVTSSEKAHSDNKYKDFKILAIPYPGCEFYSIYRNNNYNPEGLRYDWSQGFNDAKIELPGRFPAHNLNINWTEYKSWDLTLITKNYLKAILKYIQDENQGLLIHCISGWDRTPLFVSLVRLSLWADGLIHRSLNPYQMTFFTIAYDWYLFGHQLPVRLAKGEDIMFFCFDFLKYIVGDDFVVNNRRRRSKTPSNEIWDSFSAADVVFTCGESDEFTTSNEDSNDGSRNDCDSVNIGLDTINANITSQSPHLKRSRTNSTTSNNFGDPLGGSWEDLGSVQQQKDEHSTKDDRIPTANTLSSLPKNNPGKINCSNITGIRMSPAKSSPTKITSYGFVQNSGRVGSGGTSSASSTASSSSSVSSSGATPVEIPGGGSVHHRRKRTESESSFVMVTEVGSVESRESMSSVNSKDEAAARRNKRLNEVRKIFISAYHRCIGMRFPKNSPITIANFVGEIANQAAEIYNTMITTTTVEEKDEEVEAESKTI